MKTPEIIMNSLEFYVCSLATTELMTLFLTELFLYLLLLPQNYFYQLNYITFHVHVVQVGFVIADQPSTACFWTVGVNPCRYRASMQTLHRKAHLKQDPTEPSCCDVTVLTMALLCCPSYRLQQKNSSCTRNQQHQWQNLQKGSGERLWKTDNVNAIK